MTVSTSETVVVSSPELADVCQQRYIHPEHALAARQHLLPIEPCNETEVSA